MGTFKSQLSFLMPVHEACQALGRNRVSRIVSGVVIMRSNQEAPNQSYNKRVREDLNKVYAAKTDALVQAIMFVPGRTSKQAIMLLEATDMSPSSDPSTTKRQIPPSIRKSWTALLNNRLLMLDKASFFKFLIPSCAQPHSGPGGHMGLFDCLVYALQTKSASANSSSTMNGASPPPHVTIPDIIIFFAVCQKYWELQTQVDEDDIQSFSGDHPAVRNMARLMFLVYDGYQKNAVIGRDTIHRFMSDVYGEESYKDPRTKEVLTKIFSNPNAPLTGREFRDAVIHTVSYCPTPQHFLLDWMATLAQAMMPTPLVKSGNKSSGTDEEDDVSIIGNNLPESAAVLLEKMDLQRRLLPQICERYELAEYRLYEIKRRFHSLVESTTSIIQGDPMGAAVDDGGGNTNSPDSNNSNGNARRRSSVGSNAPKHFIPATVFIKKVSMPSNELGHGGYLPEDIAKQIFESVAKSSVFGGPEDGESEDEEDADENMSYWDLCHVLQFGGMCLRSTDKDKSMVEWMMQLFCKRGAKVLDRDDLESLMACLCSHADFRRFTDRPKWEREDSDDEGEFTEDSKEVMVSLTSALNLQLLPKSFKANSTNSPKVPVKTLVDQFFKTIKSEDETVSNDQFLEWHNQTKEYGQQRLGPLMIDIRLIAGVMFGVPPKLASLEHLLVTDIRQRHMKRFPQTEVSRRGPRGTIWYLLDDKWFKSWSDMVEVVRNTKDDGDDLRDKTSRSMSPRRLGQINNTKLLRDNGSLALRVDIKWRQDYEILPPLAWSALQAWYDGGPPISRTVVPYHRGSSGSSTQNNRARSISLRTDNEIELYPFFVTMFLCDTLSRGEARPFQQSVPVSRVNPIRVLLVRLCKELDVDPDTGRLWVIEPSTDPEQSGKNDWLLDMDSNIVEQRKKRIADKNGNSNISLLLELKNEETNEWPRGLNGKNWTLEKEDENSEEMGDGVVGLFNMGNTCYLNSSIQCLSHTPIFRDYFTSKLYLNDINTTNPLGHEGRMAQVYAILVSNIWKRFNQQAIPKQKRVTAPGSYAPVNAPALTPKTFKESLGKFNDQFLGNEQHDAQELLDFLLAGLSEDLNRIQNKPYIEAPDSDGRPDSELADIWWANHLKREMSIVVAMFTGQYKSLLKCKSCKYESARFEPFTILQLPLPEDDTVPVSLIFYSSDPNMGITKYSVRVHNNGTLYDVLIALAKVIHSDSLKNDGEDNSGVGLGVGNGESESEEDTAKRSSIYAKLAQNMAVVDMREGYIFKIAPNAWRLPDLQNKETGELPLLHVYGLDADNATTTNVEEKVNEVDEEKSVQETPTYSFLALAQRRSEVVSKELIHPFIHRVFGTPLLLRVKDLDGLTGSQVYDIVAKHLHHLVPQGALKFLNPDDSAFNCEAETDSRDDAEMSKEEIRQNLEKTNSDNEEVSAGPLPRYGFRLRLTTREGRRCSIRPWYECSIGCLVPDDAKPTVVANGDSLAIDWHFAVDVATGGFGTRTNQADPSIKKGATERNRVPGVEIKNHYSCGVGLKKGQVDAITLEDCLDAFAEEEKIPDTYCSKCKDFQIQTKRMSLWRLPPVVIIQFKRFQFTKHMRRKLRDFVQFPVEGLDLSRIRATDGVKNPGKEDDSSVEEKDNGGDDVIVEEVPTDDDVDVEDQDDGSSRLNGDDGRGEKLYDLYGVVHHQGALSTGHYVASLKSDIDGQWRLFNDAQVYEIHSRDVVDSSAYILFYMRRDVANQTLSDFWDVRKRVGEGLTEEEMNELIRGQSDKCVIS